MGKKLNKIGKKTQQNREKTEQNREKKVKCISALASPRALKMHEIKFSCNENHHKLVSRNISQMRRNLEF